MKRKDIVILLTIVLLCVFMAMSQVSVYAASEPKMPRVMNIIGHGVGSKLYGLAAGFAKVGSKYLPTELKAVPTAGPAEWVPMARDGEVDMAVAIGLDSMEACYGVGFFKGKKSSNMTILLRGGFMRISSLTRKDSGIMKLSDLKGKRYVFYSGGRSFNLQAKGFLANAGFTEKDVRAVTVPGPKDGVKALIEGRADATGTSEVTMGAIAELEAGRGARFLSLDNSPEGVERILKFYPVGKPVLVKPGPGVRGLVGPTWMWMYDWYLTISKNVSDDAAYHLVKTFWEHDSELWPIHGGLRQTKKDIFITENPTIPYHAGAVRFYKEKGVWTGDMEKIQQTLLSKKK